MTSTLIQMTLIMACGIGWRLVEPEGLTAHNTRLVLTSVVYYVLLPALVLEVLWKADLGVQSFEYAVLGSATILFGVALSILVGRVFKLERKRLGAMVLAASFANVTYLGLPVLEQVFGAWARSVVIQLDLFAATPMVFTVGILVARYYGEQEGDETPPLLSFFNAPPFWAAALAVALNLGGVDAPLWLLGVLQKLSAAVVPLMLFSLGLALRFRSVSVRNIPYVLPVIAIKMVLLPLFAFKFVDFLSFPADYKAAAVLDLAMPSMVLGVVFCDRYRLDSSLYAMTVTVTTLLSLVTLPFWLKVLTG